MSALVQLAPGSIFAGDFRVVRPLAEGGMGAVYEVVQLATGAARALKIMHPQLVTDEKLRQRFVQEAKVSALIESDHVVQVVGAGVDRDTGVPWLAMEMLKGETLADFVGKRGALSTWEVREVFSQLCHALAAAHDVGIVHRDLKPENVFLAVARREGVPFTVKVLDFGIAKLVADAQTHMTAAMGTPLWMAPEQTEQGGAIRPATDVWALGLIAFHLLTGCHYWRVANGDRMSAAVLLREVILEPLVAASERAQEYGRRDRIPPGFDGWFARCVVREVDRRFQNAREAREALEQVLAVSQSGPLGIAPPMPYVVVPQPTPAPQRVSAAAPTVGMDAAMAHAPSHPHLHSQGTPSPAVSDEVEADAPPASSFPILPIAIVGVLLIGGVGAIFAFRGNGGGPTPVASASATPTTVTAAQPARPCPPGMASIPGGSYWSSSRGAKVDVAPYCLDQTEVTVADWAECQRKGLCTDAGLSAAPLCNWPAKSAKSNHPLNCVDWDGASGYCAAVGKRLPTLEEWEWAARGGDKGSTYPWGDDAPSTQLCWSGDMKRAALGTCEVKTHATGVSPFGVYDLAGNVAEWVAPVGATQDSVRPALGDHFLTEATAFEKDVSGRTSVASRLVARKAHETTVGFRCAREP